MRIWTNAIVAGGMLAAAVILKKLVRSRRGAEATPTDELTFSAPPQRGAGATAVAELKKDLLVFASEERFAT